MLVTIGLLFAGQARAESCLELNSEVVGDTSLGTNFTDYEYLVKNEDNTFTYKLAAVQLCVNSAKSFVGMRSVIGKVLTGQVSATSLTPLNRIGAVNETGIVCTNLPIDYVSGDYIQNLTIWTSSTNVVKVGITTNNGTTLSKGTASSSSKS